MPGLREADVAAARLEQRERGDHGGEDAREQYRDLHDGPPVEMVRGSGASWSESEREHRQSDQDHLAHEREMDGVPGPAQRPGEEHGRYDEEQGQDVHPALDSHGDVVLSVHIESALRLLAVGAYLDDEVGHEAQPYDQQPFRPEAESPRERHSPQEAQEQGRAERGQQAAHVAGEEDEEDDSVTAPRALAVGAQKRAYQHHGRAHCSDETREHRAREQEGHVGPRSRDLVAREVDPTRDGEEREEQHEERDVLLGGASGLSERQVAEAHDQEY